MSISQLNALVDELDLCIRHYSACLVRELALREELEYEQEVKDVFFTRLHEVQTRMDEWIATTQDSACQKYDGENIDTDDKGGGRRRGGLFGGSFY